METCVNSSENANGSSVSTKGRKGEVPVKRDPDVKLPLHAIATHPVSKNLNFHTRFIHRAMLAQ